MSQTKAQLVSGLNLNPSAPATALQIDASGNINLDSNTLYVDATNNRVGLGTSSPGATFEAYTSSARRVRIGETPGYTASDYSALGGSVTFSRASDNRTDLHAIYAYDNAGPTKNNLAITSRNDTVFINDNAERLRITDTGRVGIGTTAPARLLTLNATEPMIQFTNPTTGTTANDGTLLYQSSENFNLELQDSGFFRIYTGGSERVRLDSSGRLLVGTSTARTNFFNGADSSQLQLEGTSTSTASLAIIRNSDNIGYPILNLAKARGASVGSTTIVQNNDYVGGIEFQGSDGTEFVQAASITAQVDGTPGANDMPGRLVFSTTADGASSPTERMRIRAEGSISMPGVYDFTTASAANVVVSSGGNLNRSTSSAKYKTDIETLEDSYADALLNIRPVWYRSTCANDNPAYGWWGLIAEEVAAIDPRLVHWKTVEVTYDDKGAAVQTPCDPEPEGVQYDRFVPHLLNLIKRQGEAIAELQAEVAALKGA